MIRMRGLAGALVGVLLLAAAGPALAQASGREPSMRGGGRGDGELWLMIRASNLTPEQQTRVRAILSAHRKSASPLVEHAVEPIRK